MKDEPVFYTIPLDSPPSSRRSGPSSPAQKAPTSDDHVLIFPNRSGSKKRRARVQIHPDGIAFYQMDNGNVGSTSDGSSHEAKQVDAQIPAQRSDVYIVRSQPSQELLVIPLSPFQSRAAPLLTPGKMYPKYESSRWTAAPAARKTEKPQTPPKSPVVDAPEAAADPPKMIVRAPMPPLVRAPPPGPVVPAIELVAPFAVEAPQVPAVAAAEEVVAAEENPPAPDPAVQEHAHEPPASCWQWFVYCCCCKCCYKT
ncbi:hypothetical protein L3Y34_016579 [Caenorhabditis briggsae]|uniref:Uncharacterized protein n=1 Tax=Caenorhabditis briggsae TaxID=6238 RepID=A0AAE9DYN4_CAEBR|nr:hypothetical protein L3Y34_016579 [Caenorhabditis briggsae]